MPFYLREKEEFCCCGLLCILDLELFSFPFKGKGDSEKQRTEEVQEADNCMYIVNNKCNTTTP